MQESQTQWYKAQLQTQASVVEPLSKTLQVQVVLVEVIRAVLLVLQVPPALVQVGARAAPQQAELEAETSKEVMSFERSINRPIK